MLLQFASNRLRQSNSNVFSSDAKSETAQSKTPAAVFPGQRKRRGDANKSAPAALLA